MQIQCNIKYIITGKTVNDKYSIRISSNIKHTLSFINLYMLLDQPSTQEFTEYLAASNPGEVVVVSMGAVAAAVQIIG